MKANQTAKGVGLIQDETAAFGIGAGVVTALILFGIAISVAAAVLPSAITDLEDTDTTNWSTGVATLWDLSPLIVVAGFIMLILSIAGMRGANGDG